MNAKTDYEETPLHLAVKQYHKEIAELLIAEGADVNASNNWAETPLHHAAYWGLDLAELLIAKGANVNAKIRNGQTPLDLAIERNRTATADLLRKHGAKTGEELKAAGN